MQNIASPHPDETSVLLMKYTKSIYMHGIVLLVGCCFTPR